MPLLFTCNSQVFWQGQYLLIGNVMMPLEDVIFAYLDIFTPILISYDTAK